MQIIRVFQVGCAFVFLSAFSIAQITVVGASPDQRSSKQHAQVTVEDVVKMSKAGLSDDVIIHEIKKNAKPFDLSPTELVELKTASVSDPVIRAMVSVPAETSTAVASSSKTVVSNLPSEVGVYVKQQGNWVEVLPEIVNWKTGGVLKNIATIGVVKGDLNGHINGSSSRLSVAQPIEMLIVAPEGIAITEYQLLHLRENSGNREFRTVTGGVLHVSSGATRDFVDFKWDKVAPKTFSLKLEQFSRGEYGLLPPGAVLARNASGSDGKLYTFRIIE